MGMKIQLYNAAKRYNEDWIFSNVNYNFESGHRYAITGPNGSGKSTLLQCISGAVTLNKGTCKWLLNEKSIKAEHIYQYVSFCAPYLELVEEMTLEEMLRFHNSFKPFIENKPVPEIIREIDLESAKNKKINQFSSGMKQRVKLAQAIFSDTSLLLLDEPCTNLDTKGIELYHTLIEKYGSHRLVVVSSNDPVETVFCDSQLHVLDYKPH